MKKTNSFVTFTCVSFLLASCAPELTPVISLNSSSAMTKLDFSNQSTAVYSVDGLKNQSVFLVKMNVSGGLVDAMQTGRVYSYSMDGRAVSVGESDTLAGSTEANSDLASFPSDGRFYPVDSLPA